MEYSNNTIRRAEQILGYGITDSSGERYFSVVDGVIYTDLFAGTVTIPNYTGTFKRAFNGRVNGVEYYNEIILDDTSKCLDNVALSLSWGDDDFLTDIKDLLDWLEANPATDTLDDAGVKSKKIEDFNVTMKDTEEVKSSGQDAILAGWGWYIRRPLIVGVSSEQRDGSRYF